MTARKNAATLRPSGPFRDDSVSAADAWLPKSGTLRDRKGGKPRSFVEVRVAREAEDPAHGADEAALRWLPGQNVGFPAASPRPKSAAARPTAANGTQSPSTAPVVNGSRTDRDAEALDAQRLVELQKTEIAVLAARVQELEAELRTAKKDGGG
jgi:hypothetical protein